MSMSQILYRDYNTDEALLIIEEMNDMLNTKLKSKNLTTKLVYLGITYSRDLYKRFSESILLNVEEDKIP